MNKLIKYFGILFASTTVIYSIYKLIKLIKYKKF